MRTDPEKIRLWQQRSRKPLERSSRGLERSKPKRRRKIPKTTLALIERYSNGRCVVCGRRCNSRRDRHHVLPVEKWPEFELVAENQALVCLADHMNHEAATRRLRLDELPIEVLAWVRRTAARSGSVEIYVRRVYGDPTDPAG